MGFFRGSLNERLKDSVATAPGSDLTLFRRVEVLVTSDRIHEEHHHCERSVNTMTAIVSLHQDFIKNINAAINNSLPPSTSRTP
jgi:hypothetical protein